MFKKIVIIKHEQAAPMHIVNQAREFLTPTEIVATIRVSKEWKESVKNVRVKKLSFTRKNKSEELKMLSLFHRHLEEILLTHGAPARTKKLTVDFPKLKRLRLNFAEEPKIKMQDIAVHLLSQPSLLDVTLDIENIYWLSFEAEVPWESLEINGGNLPMLQDRLPNLRALDICADEINTVIDFRRYPRLQSLTLHYQEVMFSHEEECKLDELKISATRVQEIPNTATLPRMPLVVIKTYIDHGMLDMWNTIVENRNFEEVRITHDDEDPDFHFFLVRSKEAIIFSVGPAASDYDLEDFIKRELGPWLREISRRLNLPVRTSRADMNFRQRYKLVGLLLDLNIFTDEELERMLAEKDYRRQRRFSMISMF